MQAGERKSTYSGGDSFVSYPCVVERHAIAHLRMGKSASPELEPNAIHDVCVLSCYHEGCFASSLLLRPESLRTRASESELPYTVYVRAAFFKQHLRQMILRLAPMSSVLWQINTSIAAQYLRARRQTLAIILACLCSKRLRSADKATL